MLLDIHTFLLDTQRALLGTVTPSLRACSVDIDTEEKRFDIFFFFDEKVTEELADLASTAATEAGVTLPDYFTNDKIIQLDYPEQIPVKGHLVFLRVEAKKSGYIREKFVKYLEESNVSAILFLELQQALLGRVLPSLREVSVRERQGEVLICFYYDGEIDSKAEALAEVTLQEMRSGLSGWVINKKVLRMDYPAAIVDGGDRLAYRRYERI